MNESSSTLQRCCVTDYSELFVGALIEDVVSIIYHILKNEEKHQVPTVPRENNTQLEEVQFDYDEIVWRWYSELWKKELEDEQQTSDIKVDEEVCEGVIDLREGASSVKVGDGDSFGWDCWEYQEKYEDSSIGLEDGENEKERYSAQDGLFGNSKDGIMSTIDLKTIDSDLPCVDLLTQDIDGSNDICYGLNPLQGSDENQNEDHLPSVSLLTQTDKENCQQEHICTNEGFDSFSVGKSSSTVNCESEETQEVDTGVSLKSPEETKTKKRTVSFADEQENIIETTAEINEPNKAEDTPIDIELQDPDFTSHEKERLNNSKPSADVIETVPVSEETSGNEIKIEETKKKLVVKRSVSFADDEEITETVEEENIITSPDQFEFEEIDLSQNNGEDKVSNELVTSFQQETEELSQTLTFDDDEEEDNEIEEERRRQFQENWLALQSFETIWSPESAVAGSSMTTSRSNSDGYTAAKSAEIHRGQVRSIVQQFEEVIQKNENPVNLEEASSRDSKVEPTEEVVEELKTQIAIMVNDYRRFPIVREDVAIQVGEVQVPEDFHINHLKFYVGEGSGDEDDPNSSMRGVDNLSFLDSEDLRQVDVRSTVAEAPTPTPCSSWRCTWPEHVSTALSILSLAGTLGNLIRLPPMVYFHGGGVFLLVYIVVTLLFGIPLTFLEVGLGQFCQHGTIKLWRAVNLFRGVGYAKVFLSFAAAVYYSVQVATALALLTWTAKGPLPFSECNFLNENGTRLVQAPGERCLTATFLAPVEDDPLGFGVVLIFLLIVWALVLVCVLKRSATYRRAMYFLFPGFFALLAALLVEASSRSNEGILKLFTFHWHKLADVQVWYFAIVQMFFSLQIGFGNINTCAGRIYPKSNAFWTALCLVIMNLVMGVAAVCLTYLWIGQVEAEGLELPNPANVPELFFLTLIYNVSAICIAEWSTLWASIAYILVLGAGLSSLIVFIYTVLVAVAIETKRKWHWWHINSLVCLVACTLAILSIIPSHQSVPHVLDHYLISRGVVFLTILELIGFAMVYGCSNLYNDLEFVIGKKLSSAWRSLWIVTPFVLIIVEVCSANLLPLDGVAPEKDSIWEYSLGWALYFALWLIVLVCAIWQVCLQVDFDITQKIKSAVKPSRNWGPVDPIYRHCWVQWRNRYTLTGTRDFTLKRRGTRDYTHHARTATADSVSHSFDMSGVQPGGEWGYKRPTSTPVKADYPTDNIFWKKPEAPASRH